ncbi:DUF2007 domain-containing protein [Mangrovivirga sp. M17]|uniref:DUF2007 domain-containing protein n=1 Tax=Mangrovivirga halotolerans TaxID=2993936 RepID=A0ABT3RL33_9BACT|nr:DUF2007 domain-containing protein [Mangrovivirga halotolerans]MCX2742529.1 DUF2007 domain-containing protein [Mangrovivirga halotolerans]
MGLVLLLREYDYNNAHIMRSKLQQHGVPVVLIDEETSVTLPHLKTLIGGIGLMVLEDDYEMARDILGLKYESPAKIVVCPHCNSTNAKPIQDSIIMSLITRIFNIFTPDNQTHTNEKKYQCIDCENTFLY